MPADIQGMMGRAVYARDDMKIGEVKGATDDSRYLIVDRPLSADLFVPVAEVLHSGDRLFVDRTSSYLDSAPDVGSRGSLSIEERRRLDLFYASRAA